MQNVFYNAWDTAADLGCNKTESIFGCTNNWPIQHSISTALTSMGFPNCDTFSQVSNYFPLREVERALLWNLGPILHLCITDQLDCMLHSDKEGVIYLRPKAQSVWRPRQFSGQLDVGAVGGRCPLRHWRMPMARPSRSNFFSRACSLCTATCTNWCILSLKWCFWSKICLAWCMWFTLCALDIVQPRQSYNIEDIARVVRPLPSEKG